MNILVRLGFAAIFAAFAVDATNLTTYTKQVPVWVVFLSVGALIYFAIGGYVRSKSDSKVVLPIATILLLVVIILRVVPVETYLKLPASIAVVIHAPYALIATLGIYFIALFTAK